jgi:hypothetical protein
MLSLSDPDPCSSRGHYYAADLCTQASANAVCGLELTVFSLRIRMKAETTATEDTDDSPVVGSPPSLPRSGSDADSAAETVTPENGESSSRSGNDSATVQASTSRITSAARKPSKPEATQVETKKSQGSLVGKINNLVTVDLGTIGS